MIQKMVDSKGTEPANLTDAKKSAFVGVQKLDEL